MTVRVVVRDGGRGWALCTQLPCHPPVRPFSTRSHYPVERRVPKGLRLEQRAMSKPDEGELKADGLHGCRPLPLLIAIHFSTGQPTF